MDRKYFAGVGVVIDDEICDPTSNAFRIAAQIEEEGIPLLRFRNTESCEPMIASMHNVSFVVLDWRFDSRMEKIDSHQHNGEVALPLLGGASSLESEGDEDTVEFLLGLLDSTVCPVFIISSLGRDDVLRSIYNVKGDDYQLPLRVMIGTKSELKTKDELWNQLNAWVYGNPAVYVLKTWKAANSKAEKSIFLELEKKSSCWPSILWKTYEHEFDPSQATAVNKSHELVGVLNAMLVNRAFLECSFEEKYVLNNSTKSDVMALKSVLEIERYISFSSAQNVVPLAPGDIFKENERYYINLRAQCDTLRIQSPMAILIPGDVVDQTSIDSDEDGVRYRQGQLFAKETEVVIPYIDNGKIIRFQMRGVRTKTVSSSYINKRIGRLLPPFVTKFQQQFASYIIREGIPSLPAELFSQEALGVDKMGGEKESEERKRKP